MELVPRLAPLVVLAFLGTIAVVGAALLTALVSALTRHMTAARRALAAAAAAAAAYALALGGFSLASREKVLAPGQEKVFCELDCHISYSLAGAKVEHTAEAGAGFDRLVVAVRSHFDEASISARRGYSALTPNPRRLVLVDESGHERPPLAMTAAADAPRGLAPISQPLRPGESYLTEVVFELPAHPELSRVFLGADDPILRLLIGHENSPLHGRALFALPALAVSAAAPLTRDQKESEPTTP